MTTLAEAAVQVVADGDGFERRLVQQIEDTGGAADRAARNVGRRSGTTLSREFARSLGDMSRTLRGPVEQTEGVFRRLSRTVSSSLAPASRSTATLSRDLGRVGSAAESVAAVFDSLGSTISTAVATGTRGVRDFSRGLRDVEASADSADSAALRLGQTFAGIGASARRTLSGLPDTLSRIGTSAGRTHSAFMRMSATLTRVGAVGAASLGGVGALLLALPATASLAATTAAGAWAVGISAIGIITAAQSEEVQAEFIALAEHVVDAMTGIAGPIERALSSLSGDLTGLFDDLLPSLDRSFVALGPAMESFFSEITSSMRSLGPLTEASSEAFSDLLVVLGPGLGGAIERLSGSLTELARSSDPQFFTDTVVAIVDFAAALIDLITWLSQARAGLADDLAPAVRAIRPLFSGLGEGLSQVGDAALRFGGAFIDAVVPAIEELEPVLSSVGEAFDTAGGLVAGLLDDITPALSALQPLAEGFAEGFMEAREVIFGFLGDLLGQLGPAEGALRGLAEWLGENEELVRLVGVALGTVTAVLVTYRTAVLAATVASGLLRAAVTGLGVAIRSIPVIGWIITAIGLLVIVVQQLWERSETFREIVTNVWGAVSDAFSEAWGVIQGIVDGFSDAWEDLTGGVDFATALGDAWEWLSGAVSDGWDVMSGVFSAVGEGIRNVVDGARDAGILAGIWDGFKDGVQTMWDIVGPVFSMLGETLAFLGDLITGDATLRDLGGIILDWFSTLQGVGEEIAGFLIRQMQRIPGLVLAALAWFGDTFGEWLFEQLAALPEYAVEALAGLPETIGNVLAAIPDQLAEFLGVTEGWEQWFLDLGSAAIAGLTEVGQDIAGWFTGLPDLIEQALGVTEGWGAWFEELAATAVENLRELGESIAEYVQGIPDLVAERIGDGQRILAWLMELPGRITEFMSEYGPQILRGFAIALGIVVAGIPALFLGLLASILFVLGVIAWELLQWAWSAFTGMMDRAAEATLVGIGNLVTWFSGLPDQLLAAVQGLGARLVTWASGAVTGLRGAMTRGLNSLRTWWNTTWTNIFTSARTYWNNFVTWVGGAAGRILSAVTGPLSTLSRRMVSAFNSARIGIERAWALIRTAVGRPIEWVVNTVYNDWIRGVWGKIQEKFGGPTLPGYTVKFAKGGVFPGYTPGRDVHAVPMAAFSGGESILRPEVTRAWGSRTTHWLNKLARSGGVSAVRRALAMLFGGYNPFTGGQVPRVSPAGGSGGGGFTQRFARGGIVSSIGGTASDAWKWLSSTTDDFTDGMLDFLEDPGGILRKLFDQIVDLSKMPNGGTGWADLIRRIPRKLMDLLVEKAKSLFSFDGDWTGVGGAVGGRLGAALAFAKSQAGKPYVWGGVGPRGYDCSGLISAVHNVILGKRPYSRRYTTHPFTGSSYGGFRRNMPSPFMIGVTHANVGHMSGTLLRTNIESRGSAGVVVGARARGWNNSLYSHRYGMVGSSSPRNSRMGGEGILYDTGGWLLPGMSMVGNFTGRPESIRTWAQEKNVSEMVRLLKKRVPLRAEPLVPQSRQSEFNRAMSRSGLGGSLGGTVVNAPITLTAPHADPSLVAARVVDRLVQKAGI